MAALRQHRVFASVNFKSSVFVYYDDILCGLRESGSYGLDPFKWIYAFPIAWPLAKSLLGKLFDESKVNCS